MQKFVTMIRYDGWLPVVLLSRPLPLRAVAAAPLKLYIFTNDHGRQLHRGSLPCENGF